MSAARRWRLLALAGVALGLAPGTFVRSPKPPENRSQVLTVERLAAAPRQFGEFRFLAAWRLTSANSRFGGYSALVVPGEGRLLAINDAGGMLEMPMPDRPAAAPARIAGFGPRDPDNKAMVDSEAATRDPLTGMLWVAYESSGMIVRYDRAFLWRGYVFPAEIGRWPKNGGPEGMLRLRDGRFIVLSERDPKRGVASSPGLLFPGDPVDKAQPAKFTFEPPAGYRPTDLAELPDGRVAILLRTWKLGLPVRFPSKLAVADPAEIRAGGVWRAQVVADLFGPIPSDNYEGIAIDPEPGGGATVWIVSDDNTASFQRTLLLKFSWNPGAPTQKARGSPARLSANR